MKIKKARPDAESKIRGKTAIKARLWIEKNGETFLASGRVTLLERIAHYGSISNAARSMKMSYRHAWLLVEHMNRLSRKPLVKTLTGGKGGGGAILTNEAKKMIELFYMLQRKLHSFLKQESRIMEM